MIRSFYNRVLRWLALWLVDPARLRRCRLQIVLMELMKGDQSGEHLKKVLSKEGFAVSSVQFYAMMAGVSEHAELFYVQMPFGQQKVPYFHLKSIPPSEVV